MDGQEKPDDITCWGGIELPPLSVLLAQQIQKILVANGGIVTVDGIIVGVEQNGE